MRIAITGSGGHHGRIECNDDRVTGLVPAVGGTRSVPAPDAIATDYILLTGTTAAAGRESTSTKVTPGRLLGELG